jgi:hypothetical protein
MKAVLWILAIVVALVGGVIIALYASAVSASAPLPRALKWGAGRADVKAAYPDASPHEKDWLVAADTLDEGPATAAFDFDGDKLVSISIYRDAPSESAAHQLSSMTGNRLFLQLPHDDLRFESNPFQPGKVSFRYRDARSRVLVAYERIEGSGEYRVTESWRPMGVREFVKVWLRQYSVFLPDSWFAEPALK